MRLHSNSTQCKWHSIYDTANEYVQGSRPGQPMAQVQGRARSRTCAHCWTLSWGTWFSRCSCRKHHQLSARKKREPTFSELQTKPVASPMAWDKENTSGQISVHLLTASILHIMLRHVKKSFFFWSSNDFSINLLFEQLPRINFTQSYSNLTFILNFSIIVGGIKQFFFVWL